MKIRNRRDGERDQAGFSIVELMVSAAVLTIGFGAVVTNLVTMTSLQGTNRESAIAAEAAESAIERLRGEDFERIYASFNSNPADDPDGPGTAPGASFDVPGLTAQEGDADGLVGEIVFPGDGTQLLETTVDDALGMPRDLNADTVVDALDHAADHTLLPFRIRLRWTGNSGNRELELVSCVTRTDG